MLQPDRWVHGAGLIVALREVTPFSGLAPPQPSQAAFFSSQPDWASIYDLRPLANSPVCTNTNHMRYILFYLSVLVSGTTANAQSQPSSLAEAVPVTAPASAKSAAATLNSQSLATSPSIAKVTDTPSKKMIVIDPGHGGHDTGARVGDAHESEIALAISKIVASELQKDGYRVLLTRSKNEWISLEKRAAIANESDADLFVSIHLNSSTDARAQGKELYFQNQLAVDEEALFLANRENHEHEDPTNPSVNPGQDRIQKAGLRTAEAARLPKLEIANHGVRTDVRNILEDLDRSARIRDSSELAKILYGEWQASESQIGHGAARGIRQAPFFLVSNVAMPSVLVEVGFLSHGKEGAKLQQPTYQASLANALANGIDRFMKRDERSSIR